jgi:leucyl/phenylalanyl-tRNA--protein transferase
MPRSVPPRDCEPEYGPEADDDGLVAVGGTLHPDVLEKAYRMGIFPWSSAAGGDLVVSRSSRDLRTGLVSVLAQFAQADSAIGLDLHLDRDFEGTMRRCAEPRRTGPAPGFRRTSSSPIANFIGEELAHSVEVYEERKPWAGFTAWRLGASSAANPCSRRRSNASKAALCPLWWRICAARGFALLDAQVMNPHLASLGARDLAVPSSFAGCVRRSRSQGHLLTHAAGVGYDAGHAVAAAGSFRESTRCAVFVRHGGRERLCQTRARAPATRELSISRSCVCTRTTRVRSPKDCSFSTASSTKARVCTGGRRFGGWI